jgi:hypothetical protein
VLLAAVWCTFVMHVRLQEYCPWWLTLHLVNASMFVAAFVCTMK